ncbi:MAG: hypothetical protein LLG08_10505 [Actinomycetia bacterium]|nr:hypothetical protein [Actinomycetes bacterium]
MKNGIVAGEIVYEPDRAGNRALDGAVVKTAGSMLHDVVENRTTQAYRAAWFVGYSGDPCTAVWVGRPDGQVSMTDVHGIRVTGGSFPAKIWQRFMRVAVSAHDGAATAIPSASADGDPQSGAQVKVTICIDTLLPANPRCPNTVEIYLDDALAQRSICKEH